MGAYVSHRYLKSFSDAAHHVRYIAFREREDKSESLGLFSYHTDHADAEKFIETLNAKRFKHEKTPNLHTVLFSMSGWEWNSSGFQPGDYQKIIRHVMREWEIKTGYRLEWVAAEHRNPNHPHCHVAIRAAYTDRDGVEHRLIITNEDRKFFREQFEKAKELYRPIDPPPRELYYHQQEHEQQLYIDTSLLDNLIYKIQRDLEQEEWEREQARQKAKQKGRDR